MRGRRALLYAGLALLVPLPALAVTKYEAAGENDAPGGLAVSVALERCALLEARILCKLNVSYDPVADATSYVASVTGPGGSVVDGGALGPGGGSIWVAYTGDGTYTVEVSAFGEPDEPGGEAKLLSRDEAAAEGGGFEAAAGEGAAEAEEEPEEPPAEPEPEPDVAEEPAEPPLPPCPASAGEESPVAAGAASGDAAAAAEQVAPEPATDPTACADESG